MADPTAMSLDEYMANRNIKRPPQAKSQNNNSLPARFRRLEEKGEESDDEMDGKVWRGPSSSIDVLNLDCDDELNDKNNVEDVANNNGDETQANEYTQSDLRHKITGPLPDLNSQQWRLLCPNNNPERRMGVPPLVPRQLLNYIKPNDMQRQGQGRNRRRNRNFQNDSGNGWNNRNGGGNGNRPYCNRNNDNYNKNNNRNGMMRFGNSNMNNDMANIKLNLNLLNQGLNALLRLNTATENCNAVNNPAELSICQEASSVDLNQNPPLARFHVNRPSPSTSIDASRENFMIGGNDLRNHSNVHQMFNENSTGMKVEQSLVGVNDNKFPNIPMMATKFLEYLEKIKADPVHKPFYDMKVQKEIHTIQDKPLIYKKSDTPVVISSDGAGLDCEIIPRSSGMSMNYRFT